MQRARKTGAEVMTAAQRAESGDAKRARRREMLEHLWMPDLLVMRVRLGLCRTQQTAREMCLQGAAVEAWQAGWKLLRGDLNCQVRTLGPPPQSKAFVGACKEAGKEGR